MTRSGKWQIALPWPPSKLSPNARTHWAQKAKSAKEYRRMCWSIARKAALTESWNLGDAWARVDSGEAVHLFMDFYPPDRRARDDDNIISAFKSGRDGIADALGVDDARFRIHPMVRTGEVVKRGQVLVTITIGPQPNMSGP